MSRANQKGVALILALISLLVLSVVAVSLMFLSQTETWSSLNYRLMSQARDGAEAGVNGAANFIINNYSPPSTTSVTDPISNYNIVGVADVQYPASATTGHDVILSANSSVSSNYPVSSVQDSFNSSNAGKGSIAAGYTTVKYNTSARLLYMQAVDLYGSLTPGTIQTWEITSDGNIGGARGAQVEVSAILERQIGPTFDYAAFATSPICSALSFGGGGTTDSYDSSNIAGGIQQYGGNVGTNGNLSTNGQPTTIYGTLSTPKTGVGTCGSSNVTAWTSNQGSVTDGLVELPQTVVYPPPPAVSPLPGTTLVTLNNGPCPGGLTGCTGTGGVYAFAPGGCAPSGTPTTYPNVTLNGTATLTLTSGCYNFNTLTLSGMSQLIISATSGPVILNIAGLDSSGNPLTGTVLDLTGGGIVNTSLVPSNFQVLYGGTGSIKLTGGASAAGLIYAPDAPYSFTGGGDWYGAIIGAQLTDMGGAHIHYDRQLQNSAYMLGNFTLGSFTWKKYQY
jgi:Tfp pilus assembly protein PilX